MQNRLSLTLPELLAREPSDRRERARDLFGTVTNSVPLRKHDCYWRGGAKRGIDLPFAIVPAEEDIEGFFADVATYYPDVSPISSLCHILRLDTVESLGLDGISEEADGASKGRALTQIKIWIALSIAEAANISYASGATKSEPTYALCRRSLSFSLGRCAFLHPKYSTGEFVERWQKLRELTGMDFDRSVGVTVKGIADIAMKWPLSETRGSSFIGGLERLVQGLVWDDLPDHEFGNLLVRMFPRASSYLEILRGEFDGRMSGLENVIKAVEREQGDPEVGALAIAFFTNTILPGSLSYLGFLSRFRDAYPSILIWYGFFSGLANAFDLRAAGGGIGQKLYRDLTRRFDLDVAPIADISLDELLVLSRIGLKSEIIRPVQQRSVLVSLLPGVEVFTRFTLNDRDLASDSRTSSGKAGLDERGMLARDQRIRRLINEVDRLLTDSLVGSSFQSSKTEKEVRKGTTTRRRGTSSKG